jgi:hypothetical protein
VRFASLLDTDGHVATSVVAKRKANGSNRHNLLTSPDSKRLIYQSEGGQNGWVLIVEPKIAGG